MRENIPFDIKTTIEDEDHDLTNVSYRLKFWLSPEYYDSPLDNTNNGLYLGDWHNASLFTTDVYGTTFSQAQFDSQIALGFMQVIPSTFEYAIDFRVIDHFYNQDIKTLRFRYNPIIELTAVEGNKTFPNLNPPSLWTLATWSNFSTISSNVKVNELAEGIMDIHSSLLYVPRSFKIMLPAEYADAQNYRTYQRYRYVGNYLNKTSIIYQQIYSTYPEGRISWWDFPLENHFPVSKILFNYETPRLIQSPYESKPLLSGGEQVTIPFTISSRHNFTFIEAKVPTYLFHSNYNWHLYLKIGQNYVEQDLNAWNFTVITSTISPQLYFNLPQIGRGEVYAFKVVGNEIFVVGFDTTPFWLALIMPLSFIIIPWLLFYYRSSEYVAERNLFQKYGATKFYLIWGGIFVASYALGVILWSIF